MAGTTALEKAKAEVAELEQKRKGLRSQIKDLKKAEPLVLAGKMGVGLGAAFSAGASDRALQRRGITTPGGVQASQVTGVLTAIGTIGAAAMGYKRTSEWMLPAALGQLAPSAYGMGATASDNIEAAVATDGQGA